MSQQNLCQWSPIPSELVCTQSVSLWAVSNAKWIGLGSWCFRCSKRMFIDTSTFLTRMKLLPKYPLVHWYLVILYQPIWFPLTVGHGLLLQWFCRTYNFTPVCQKVYTIWVGPPSSPENQFWWAADMEARLARPFFPIDREAALSHCWLLHLVVSRCTQCREIPTLNNCGCPCDAGMLGHVSEPAISCGGLPDPPCSSA